MEKTDQDVARKRDGGEKAFGFKSLVPHRSSIVDTLWEGVEKDCRRRSDLSFNLPHNSSMYLGRVLSFLP